MGHWDGLSLGCSHHENKMFYVHLSYPPCHLLCVCDVWCSPVIPNLPLPVCVMFYVHLSNLASLLWLLVDVFCQRSFLVASGCLTLCPLSSSPSSSGEHRVVNLFNWCAHSVGFTLVFNFCHPQTNQCLQTS